MARRCDVVIVVGSGNSSNSNRLRDVANDMNVPAYLVENAGELQAKWLEGKQHVGLTAGASTPELLVQELIARLKQLGVTSVHELHGVSENVVFPLPEMLNFDATDNFPLSHLPKALVSHGSTLHWNMACNGEK
jgi:4-hydroxy-3-methylbut-2-enyl diphosphate reductase